MEDDERVIAEGVSRYGLHAIHVMRSNGMVDVEKWIREVVQPMNGQVEAFYQYKDEVGMHHLRLYWRNSSQEVSDGR